VTDIDRLLGEARTIAVVGISQDPAKAAHAVPAAVQASGYRIVPVSPRPGEVLGEPIRAALADVEEPVDIVNVFRPAAEAPEIARQAVEAGARAVWLQLGIVSPEARAIAEGAGLDYVEDRCISVELRRRRISPSR
jgi:uncharacterized protein